VGVSQARGQPVGPNQQREREQNTQKFHVLTFAFSKYCEIGMPPFLVSVFGLQERGLKETQLFFNRRKGRKRR